MWLKVERVLEEMQVGIDYIGFVVYVKNFGVFLSVLGNLCWV